MTGECSAPVPAFVAVLAPAYQRLWLVRYNDASESSPVLALRSTLAPDRFDVSSRASTSRRPRPPSDGGYVVRVL